MSEPYGEALASLPWRGPDGDRPALQLPPEKMPLRFRGGWRKRWRYVSAFGEELMICAASVQVGPASQTFWAVLDRDTGELHERTRMRMPGSRGEVWNEDSKGHPLEIGMDERGAVCRFASGDIKGKLTIGAGAPWQECVAPAPDGDASRYAWTRKRVAPVEVDVTLPGEKRVRAEMRGVEDESAGYHPRHTSWRWSAGVGTAADGREVGWNLVAGINDPPTGSERAVWVDGEPVAEPAPVSFTDLDAIDFDSGARLEFTKEAERAREENKAVFRSSYRQPFGTFSGSLDGIELASAVGVMESHDAVW
jgi:hypothetical protein